MENQAFEDLTGRMSNMNLGVGKGHANLAEGFGQPPQGMFPQSSPMMSGAMAYPPMQAPWGGPMPGPSQMSPVVGQFGDFSAGPQLGAPLSPMMGSMNFGKAATSMKGGMGAMQMEVPSQQTQLTVEQMGQAQIVLAGQHMLPKL